MRSDQGSQFDRQITFAHVAETSEQARQDVKFGLEDFTRYFSEVATFPIIPPDVTSDPAEYLVSSGLACIGNRPLSAPVADHILARALRSFGMQSFESCRLSHAMRMPSPATRPL